MKKTKASPELILVKKADLKLLIISAFRYSLGRRTYMPDFVAEMIVKYISLFYKNHLELFINEINEAKELNRLGDDIDISTWKNLSSSYEKQINKLNKTIK